MMLGKTTVKRSLHEIDDRSDLQILSQVGGVQAIERGCKSMQSLQWLEWSDEDLVPATSQPF